MQNQNNKIELIDQFLLLPDDAFVDQKTIAAYKDCSEAKLERDRWAGTGLPFYKFGRHVRYKKLDVINDIEASKCTSTTTDQGGEV